MEPNYALPNNIFGSIFFQVEEEVSSTNNEDAVVGMDDHTVEGYRTIKEGVHIRQAV